MRSSSHVKGYRRGAVCILWMLLVLMITRPASHFVRLQASPVRVALLALCALRSHSRSLRSLAFRTSRSRKFSQKKCVSIDSKWSKMHRNAKKFLPLWLITTWPTPAVASLPRALRFALATYPMIPGSQGVSMPRFITIGSKLWALEGYQHTYINRNIARPWPSPFHNMTSTASHFNELMVISRKLLPSQTSYLVPRCNTWHKLFWPWLQVKFNI